MSLRCNTRLLVRAEGPDEADGRRQLAAFDPIFARIRATLTVEPRTPAALSPSE